MPDDTPQQSTTAVAPRPEKALVHDEGLFHNLMDTSRFEHLQRVANVFANSALVPEHFRGKAADCFIAVEMAMRLKLHPFNLMQSLYVVHGKPGIEAKMAIALINSSGIFRGPLQWTLSGEGMKRQATARAVHAATGQVCEAICTMEMAKAEGWIDKSGSKWKTLPDIMLQYRSASFFARLYCPEVIFGMQTADELQDAEIDVTPAATPQGAPRRSTLKERVGIAPAVEIPTFVEPMTFPEGTKVDDHGVVHVPPPQTAQEPAESTQPELGGIPPAGTPHIPAAELLGLAKRAKNQDQSDIVWDALNDPGYTEKERESVRDILRSKSYFVDK